MPGNSKQKCPKAGNLFVQVRRQVKGSPNKFDILANECALEVTGGNVDTPNDKIQNNTTYEKLCEAGYTLQLTPQGDEMSWDISEEIEQAGVVLQPETPVGSGQIKRPVAVEDNKTRMHYYKFYPYELVVNVVEKTGGKPIKQVKVKVADGLPLKDKVVETDSKGLADFGFVPNTGSFSLTLTVGAADADNYAVEDSYSPVPARIINQDPFKIELIKRLLELVSTDPYFAPSLEKIDFKYNIRGFAKSEVKLQIYGFGDKLLFERPLLDAEKQDGDGKPLDWDGKINQGAEKDQFATPLHGPLKVKLFATDKFKGEKPFAILYHSLEIKRGPWTPDEAEPDKAKEKDWVQFKLNELGYYGGPVGSDTEDYLKKAVIRYKANHKDFFQLDYANYNDQFSDASFKSALENNDNLRPFLTEEAFSDESAQSKIFIESLTYQGDEFGSAKKTDKEKERLNRPLIPVEAVIYLKKKDDSKGLAPEATGEVRVNWGFEDPDEDLSIQVDSTAAEPSFTKSYVEKCLKLKGGRSGKNGDNCHLNFCGLRQSPDAYATAPFLSGNFYSPYKVEQDGAQKVLFSKACVDKAKFAKRLGRAGIFFRPSYIAGDSYKLKAEIDFTGLPNAVDLNKIHKVTDKATRIHVGTGTFVLWRFNKVAMVVNWPKRQSPPASFGDCEWDKIKEEFKRTYTDLDVGSITEKAITDVVSEAEYQDIVAANTANSDKTKIKLNASALVGVDLPAQGVLNASQYKNALKTFTNDQYWDLIYKKLREKISANARKNFPNGFIVVNFLTHIPVDVQTAPPGDLAIETAQLITWTFSIGLPDSVIFADQKDPDKVYYVVAHEMGHNFFLEHWENAGGNAANHDRDDHNCVMSYSAISATYPFQAPGVYTPHFCGKCNLMLRGWDINHADMPNAH